MSRTKGYKCYNIQCGRCIGKTLCGEPGDAALSCQDRVVDIWTDVDYEKLASSVKLCGSTPKVDQCRKCHYWADGDMSKCIPRMTADCFTAITDLLARAEAAEARAEKAEREKDAAVNQLRGDCEKCDHYKVTWNGCTPEFECPMSDRCLNRDMWEWNGGREEE